MRRQVVHARNADKTDFAREENVGNRAVNAFPRTRKLRPDFTTAKFFARNRVSEIWMAAHE
jgi:hypothetical protein